MGSSSGGISSIEQVNQQALDSFKSKFYNETNSGYRTDSLLEEMEKTFKPILSSLDTNKNVCEENQVYWNESIIKTMKNIESNYSSNPPDFLQRSSMDNYFNLYLIFNQKVDSYIDRFTKDLFVDFEYSKQKVETSFGGCWILGYFVFVGVATCVDGIEKTSDALSWKNLDFKILIGLTFISFIIGIGLFVVGCVYDYFRNKSIKKSLDNKSYELPVKIKDFYSQYSCIKNKIENQISEALENLSHNQKIYNDLKKRVANTLMDLAERKHILMERLELMQVELEHAKKMGENLTEQHEKTESIRAKYAREMMDAQVMLAEQSDQALKEKLAMVNAMMGV
jgi:hypothetical protein